MHIHHNYFTGSPAEIDEISRFLMKSYALSLKPFNWRLAMFENWYFASRYLEQPEYFTSRLHLWRNDRGELLACVIRGTNFIHPQIDYEHRYLEPEVLDWAELNFQGDKGQLNFMVYDWDTERQALLAERGYQNLGAIEDMRIYDLNQPVQKPVLPPGFRFITGADLTDYGERIELTNQVWNMSLDEAWFRGKSTAPSYSFDLDLVVLSPEGRQVAYSLVWLYPDNRTAEIDPLGTHPEYRKRGLARALILESFRRMQENGICHAYIGSDAEDAVVSRLYSSFQPVETYQGYHWTSM